MTPSPPSTPTTPTTPQPAPPAPGHPHPPTPLRRLTLTTPDTRIDLALPADLPLADLLPELLRLSGLRPTPFAPVGHRLLRRDGTALDPSRTLAAQRVLDGEILALRPFAESLAPPVFDDVCDEVASAVARDRTLWSDQLTRTAGLFAASSLLTLLAFALWRADPGRSLPTVLATVTAVLLLALAAVRTRVYEDQAAALALGLPALAHAALAATALGGDSGRLQTLLACAAVLLASVLLTLATRTPAGPAQGEGAGPADTPFLATATAAATGLLLTFTGTLAGLTPARTAALGVPLLVGALACLPGLAARFAHLPVGFAPPRTATTPETDDTGPTDPTTPTDLARRTHRAHQLLTALIGGCALTATACAAVLGFSGGLSAQLLALALGVAFLLRAHLFRHTAQAACTLGAGLAALLLLGLGLALNPPHTSAAALDLRTIVVSAVTATAAAILTAVALVVPKKGVTPFWGRFLELAEGCVLLTLVPLCLAVFDAYRTLRGLGPR
ncbi:type VII secretion integral membrane protein EccD [Streptomyces finlayi]|uniref:Type VII secretion integral membrane protein EccD n=1 Tax=Streptomyces finlayi TaxID=67296 RepID=A0A918X293_9ACTN|nr:type VII secretion integral membrane protein EccD [Streptomyces finlayi]GHD05111.1 type VII secretion integral membrane protein EccD [Streptomyces finlayi]